MGCNFGTQTIIDENFRPGANFDACTGTQTNSPPFQSGISNPPAGTAGDPYIICNRTQLEAVASNQGLWSRFFKLSASLDLDNAGANNFVIGTTAVPFSGGFDGNGNTISNFKFVDNTQSGTGFFGVVAAPAVIQNLTINSITIDGNDEVGALVGQLNGGVVQNCHVIGTVNGSNASSLRVGGLIGQAAGTISNSTASVSMNVTDDFTGGLVGDLTSTGIIELSTVQGTITVSNLSQQSGGLVGVNSGEISIGTTTAHITGGSNSIGGFVGHNFGTITFGGASGTVLSDTAATDVGGFVGQNDGTITLSNATGNVTSNGTSVAGFVGQNDMSIQTSTATGNVVQNGANQNSAGFAGINNGLLESIFSTGNVTSNGIDTGGVFGEGGSASVVRDCYTTGEIQGLSQVGGIGGNSSGKVTSCYKTLGFTVATDAANVALNAGGGFGIVQGGEIEFSYVTASVAATGANSEQVGGFIGATSTSPYIHHAFALGDVLGTGTDVGGFIGNISTASITNVYSNNTVTTTAGISGSLVGKGEGYFEVTDAYSLGNSEGTIVGTIGAVNSTSLEASHCFTYSDVRSTSINGGGFAGRIQAGTVSLSYSAGNVLGSAGTGMGGFVGDLSASSTTITNSAAYGKVESFGTTRVGGFIGHAPSTAGIFILNSFGHGFVSSPATSVGGFAGRTVAGQTYRNVYARGNVHGGGDQIGGLFGDSQSTIANAYSTATLTNGGTNVGASIGQDTASTLSEIYWDGTIASGSVTDIGNTGNNANIISFPQTNMFQQATYAGFDFANDWVMPLGADGNGYPKLRSHYFCFGTALTDAPYANSAAVPAGTKRDPIKICTAAQFVALSTNSADWDKWFLLGEDIDFASTTLTPIGDTTTPFSGTFDGRGHTLSNFQFLSVDDNTGLFGVVQGATGPDDVDFAGEGTIMHLNVHTASVQGTNNVGVFVGTLDTGRLLKLNVTGTTSIRGTDNVGGIVGLTAKAYLTLDATTSAITDMGSLVQRATNVVTVTGEGTAIGGIVGNNAGKVEYVFNKGNVAGDPASTVRVGGVVGLNSGIISDSYAESSSVVGGSRVGGFAGTNTATITNSFSAGPIPGFVADNPGSVIQSFFDNTLATGGSAGGTGKTTTEMQQESTFTVEGRWSTGKWFFGRGYPDLLME